MSGGGQISAKPSKVRLALDPLNCRHHFLVPAAGDFGRCLFREVGYAHFEIKPELRAKDDAHERLSARANPLSKAPCQSAVVAGRAGPLFRASFTHS